VVNNCLFLDNAAVTTNAASDASGGAIATNSNLKVFDSIFKKNKAIRVDTTSGFGGGGAISLGGRGAGSANILVLSSVFELNEAANDGGAALFRFQSTPSVDWYNNKELLFGNDADEECDGANVAGEDCFNVGDNFSFELYVLEGVT